MIIGLLHKASQVFNFLHSCWSKRC